MGSRDNGVGVLAGMIVCIGIVLPMCTCSCNRDTAATPSPAYPADCQWRVAYMHGSHLVVKTNPEQPGWQYYSFSKRANGFPYAVSPGALRIAYAHTASRDASTWEKTVEVEDLRSHERRRLDGEFEAQSLSFSPSGDLIALLGLEGSMLNGWRRRGLFVWDLQSGLLSHVTGDTKRFGFGARPYPISWRGDECIVIEGANGEILSIARDDSAKPSVLTKGRSPSVSPDGRMIAFVQGDTAVLQDLSSSMKRELYRVSPEWDSGIVWSPDSQYVAYVRLYDSGRSHGIFILRVEDSSEYFIASVDGWQRFLCFIDKDWVGRFTKEPNAGQ